MPFAIFPVCCRTAEAYISDTPTDDTKTQELLPLRTDSTLITQETRYLETRYVASYQKAKMLIGSYIWSYDKNMQCIVVFFFSHFSFMQLNLLTSIVNLDSFADAQYTLPPLFIAALRFNITYDLHSKSI